MAEFSWAYIDSAAVLSAISGSVTISGSTNISGTLSASALIGDGSGLTNVAASASPAGLNTQVQYNNAGSMGASGNLTWDGSQITVVGNVTASAVSASAFYGDGSTLDNVTATSISGAMGQFNATSGLLIASGNVYLGDGASDVTIVASQLTASRGALFNEQVVIVDDKNLVFGTDGDAIIKYDEALINKLIISGSATGIELMGGGINMDYPGGTVVSGTAAGAGSFLALNSSNQVVVATPAGGGSAFPYTGDAVISGTLDVSGSISRHGFLQLGINAEQTETIANLNTVTPSGSAFPVSWNDVVRKDTAFYSHVGSVVTLIEAGDYKITYSANFSQMLPDNARSNMKTYLEKSPSGGLAFAELPYSHAYSYLRGSGDSAWGGDGTAGTTRFGTNTATTIITGTTANDELRLQFLTIGGINYGAWDMRLPAYETWITIEKI